MHICPIEIAAALAAIPFLKVFLAKLRRPAQVAK